MPLIRDLSILVCGVAIATWAWRCGHAYGARHAEKDGQLCFTRGVAHGRLEIVRQTQMSHQESRPR